MNFGVLRKISGRLVIHRINARTDTSTHANGLQR